MNGETLTKAHAEALIRALTGGQTPESGESIVWDESGDDGEETDWGFGFPVAPSFTDANRGAAGIVGRIIFNTDDGQLNIDDGTNWTLPDGTTT